MSRNGVSGGGRTQTIIVDSVVSMKLLRHSDFGGYLEARFDGCNCKDVISGVVRACVGNEWHDIPDLPRPSCAQRLPALADWR